MCFGVSFSSRQKASESVIFFQYAKHALNLDGSVHTKKCALVTCQGFRHLRTAFIEYLIDSDCSVTVFRLMTLIPVGASSASVVTVISCSYDISVFGCLCAFSSELQLSAIGTGVFILFCIVLHIFHSIWIGFAGLLFTDPVICWLDETFLPIFFKIQIILAALAACIG